MIVDFNGQDRDMDVNFATDCICFASANAQCQRCGPVSVLIGYVSANGHKT